MEKIKCKETERIIIDQSSIDEMEEDIIIRRGLERYMYVRQFVHGHVLDIACGVGYGSYLMAKNPDVIDIISVDKSEKAIDHANKHFKGDKVQYVLGQPETMNKEFDVLVCLETIEHLPDVTILRDMVEKCRIKEIIISFPNKKTTHYNEYHIWDITNEDILRLFQNHQCYQVKKINDSTIMNLIRVERNNVASKKYSNKTKD